jgi:hypothetical protein
MPKEPALIRSPAVLITVLAILQLCIAFFTDAQSFTHEESMWHYIGRNWFRHGLTPYAGGVDNKSPLIFAVFGLSDALFGINFWFPRIVGLIVQSIGLLYVYRIAVALTKNEQAGIISLTLYGLAILWHATGGKYVSFTETYAITFLLASIYYYITGTRSFISGLLAGIAIGWRLSAIFGTAAVLSHALVKRRNALLPFIIGLISGIGALLLLALAAGISLHDLYINAFADNFGSGSTTDHSLSWRFTRFTESFFYSELMLFYAPLIAYFFTNKQHSLLTTWLIFEFIGINILSIYAYPHFKQLLPPLSIVSGIAIAHLVQNHGVSFKHTMIIAWIVFFPKMTEPLTGLKKIILGAPSQEFPRPNEQAEKNLGLWIRDNTKPGDLVYVAGFGARAQLYSERLSPTVYFNVTQTNRATLQTKMDVFLRKPKLIAIPAFTDYSMYVTEDLRTFIDTLATKQYSLAGRMYGYNVYMRSH